MNVVGKLTSNLINPSLRARDSCFLDATTAAVALVAESGGGMSSVERERTHNFLRSVEGLTSFDDRLIIRSLEVFVELIRCGGEQGRTQALKAVSAIGDDREGARAVIEIGIKTTLTGHIAVQAELTGSGPVGVLDADPQESLADWGNDREADTPIVIQTSLWRLQDDVSQMRDRGMKLLLIDTPPGITSTIRSAIEVSDLVLVPVKPSPHDLRAAGTNRRSRKEHANRYGFLSERWFRQDHLDWPHSRSGGAHGIWSRRGS